MEQGVPGSQSEHFFELLHPTAARGPPPPPPPPPPPADSSSSVSSAADGSPPPSPLHAITPSYDFQLTHAPSSGGFSANLEDAPPPVLHRASPVVPPGDHHQGSSFDTSRGLVYGKPVEAMDAVDRVTMDAIDRTMKHYTNNLLQVLDCVNGRLSQLETTVQGLEVTVAGLKAAEGEKQDQSNGRLMKLELMIEEVNRGVQLLHEKQRLDEAKAHLSRLNFDDQKSSAGGVPQSHGEGWQQPRSAKEDLPQATYSEPPPQLLPQYPPPPQSHYPHTPPPPQMQPFSTSQIMLPSPSTVNGPPANSQQFPHHLPPQQPNTPQAPQPPTQNSLQIPSFHSHPAPQPPPPSSYNVPIEPPAYSHVQPTHHLPSQPAPPSSSYLPDPSQYAGGMHGGPRQPPLPQEVLHSSQQHSPIGSQHTYDSIPGRMGSMGSSMAPPSYVQSPLSKPAPQVPSMYETAGGGGYGTPYRTAQPVPSAPSGGGGGYPRLPTAQPVQHGLPAANPISSGSLTRSPLDDVIDKVCGMGFSREQVQRVVRHLTENGQSVDLNVVLDKLMNGGDSPQPARGGWFNRG